MSDAATRGRKARARDAAIRELARQGCHVWDVTEPGRETRLVAYNPEVPLLREIHVCLDRAGQRGKLLHRRGVSVEVWHREIGATAFRIEKS